VQRTLKHTRTPTAFSRPLLFGVIWGLAFGLNGCGGWI
jgi:hypothetical protein